MMVNHGDEGVTVAFYVRAFQLDESLYFIHT